MALEEETRQVLEVLRAEERPLTVKQLERRTGLSFAAAYLAVAELRQSGEVTELGSVGVSPLEKLRETIRREDASQRKSARAARGEEKRG